MQSVSSELFHKKIEVIHQVFQEELCLFERSEFQRLHDLMQRSRKKLFAIVSKLEKENIELRRKINEMQEQLCVKSS